MHAIHEPPQSGAGVADSAAFGCAGMAALKELVWKTKRAFPDLQIHVTDVFCTGNRRMARKAGSSWDRPSSPPQPLLS